VCLPPKAALSTPYKTKSRPIKKVSGPEFDRLGQPGKAAGDLSLLLKKEPHAGGYENFVPGRDLCPRRSAVTRLADLSRRVSRNS
jgi:hypothetical protein